MILTRGTILGSNLGFGGSHQVGGLLRFDKFHFGVVWSSNHLSRNRQLRLPSKSGTLGGITKEEPPVPNS